MKVDLCFLPDGDINQFTKITRGNSYFYEIAEKRYRATLFVKRITKLTSWMDNFKGHLRGADGKNYSGARENNLFGAVLIQQSGGLAIVAFEELINKFDSSKIDYIWNLEVSEAELGFLCENLMKKDLTNEDDRNYFLDEFMTDFQKPIRK